MRRRFLTPDESPDPVVIELKLPGLEGGWGAAVRGALTLLTHEYNWEQHGSITPEEAAEAFRTALLDTFQEWTEL
jgi:hypothetical protein